MKNQQKRTYRLTGASIAAASAILLVGYAVRKKKNDSAPLGALLGALVGFVAGAALAYQPERQMKKQLAVSEEFFDDDTAPVASQNISEALSTPDRAPTSAPARTVELDDEASVEDFM